MSLSPSIAMQQDRFSDWARDNGILLAESNAKTIALHASEKLGEIAQCVYDYMPDMDVLGRKIGSLIGTLLTLVEHYGRADMRYILANEYLDTVLGVDPTFSEFQKSFFASRKGRELDNKNKTADLVLLAMTQMGRLSKGVNTEDDLIFNPSVSLLMQTLCVIASKHEIDLDTVLAERLQKIRNRSGATVNGYFIKAEEIKR